MNQFSSLPLVVQLRKLLTTPNDKPSSPLLTFWFSFSLAISAAFGLYALRKAFIGEYVVQDDARQHVFWMRRFLDPQLFPNDLIADYFQSLAQPGYKAVYQIAAVMGIDPMVLNKVLPIVLGLITTGYCFAACLQLLPIPATGFAATLLLNQVMWLKDDLSSGTARAFLYPLFFAFLYYLLRRAVFPCLVALALLGLFYPSGILLCAGILALQVCRWQDGRVQLTRDRKDYLICILGLGVAFLVLLPLALESSQFGPTTTLAQAKTMPEFAPGGRSEFFVEGTKHYWLWAERSGLFPVEWSRLPYHRYFPFMLGIGLLLPMVLCFPSRFPLVRHITPKVAILLKLAIVSLGLFFAAQALLFKLYLPSRYTQYSVRIFIVLSAAIVLTVLLDKVLLTLEKSSFLPYSGRQLLALGATAVVGIMLFFYPTVFVLTRQLYPINNALRYQVGEAPELYEFLAKQPKDSLIASLSPEVDNIPSLAQRSILVGAEYAIPYHQGYYTQIRQRMIDLINAQYSPNIEEVKNFIEKYGVDFWLVDRRDYDDVEDIQKRWRDYRLNQYQPATTEALNRLRQEETPALATLINRCSVVETGNLVLLQANCITQQ